MDTASPTPARITVRVRGGLESGTVIWRKPGKVRVALRTGKVRTFDETAEWKPTTPNLTEAQRREMFPRVYAKRDAEAAAKAFEPVTIGTSSQDVEWVAYSPEDVAPMREAFEAMESRPTAEMLDFSVEAMGYCHGVNLRPMFSKVWP